MHSFHISMYTGTHLYPRIYQTNATMVNSFDVDLTSYLHKKKDREWAKERVIQLFAVFCIQCGIKFTLGEKLLGCGRASRVESVIIRTNENKKKK